MAIKVADLVAALTMDAAQYEATGPRVTRLNNEIRESLRLLAEQMRQTGVGTLTADLRALLTHGQTVPAFFAKMEQALKRIDREAQTTAASLSKLFTTIKASEELGGPFRVGTSPRLTQKSLLPRTFFPDDPGSTLAQSARSSAAEAAEASIAASAQQLARAWNRRAVLAERAAQAEELFARTGGYGTAAQYAGRVPRGGRFSGPSFDPVYGAGPAPSPFDSTAGYGTAAQYAGRVPGSNRFGPSMGDPVYGGMSPKAAKQAVEEMEKASTAAKKMGGAFGDARMMAFQLGFSMLFTLGPAIGDVGAQMIGTAIMASHLGLKLGGLITLATAASLSLGSYATALYESATAQAQLTMAVKESGDPGVGASQKSAARLGLAARQNVEKASWLGWLFAQFGKGTEETGSRWFGTETLRDKELRGRVGEMEALADQMPGALSRNTLLGRERAAKMSETLAQQALRRGNIDDFRTETEAEITALREVRDLKIAIAENDEKLFKKYAEARHEFSGPGYDNARMLREQAVAAATSEFSIAELQKREAAEKSINDVLAQRAEIAVRLAKTEHDAAVARLEANAARLIEEKDYAGAIRATTEAKIAAIRGRAQEATDLLDAEAQRLHPEERARRGPEFARRRFLITEQAGDEINRALANERTSARRLQEVDLNLVETLSDKAATAEAVALQKRLEANKDYSGAIRAELAKRRTDAEDGYKRSLRGIDQAEATPEAKNRANVEAQRLRDASILGAQQDARKKEEELARTGRHLIEETVDKAIKADASALQARLALTGQSVAASKAATTERIKDIDKEYHAELRRIEDTRAVQEDRVTARANAARARSAALGEVRTAQIGRGFGIIGEGAGAAASLTGDIAGAPVTLQGLDTGIGAMQGAMKMSQALKQAVDFGLLGSKDASDASKGYIEALTQKIEQMQKQFRNDPGVDKLFDGMLKRLKSGGLEGMMNNLVNSVTAIGAAASTIDAPFENLDNRLKSMLGSAQQLTETFNALSGAMSAGSGAVGKAQVTPKTQATPSSPVSGIPVSQAGEGVLQAMLARENNIINPMSGEI